MAYLKIITEGDPILRAVCRPVDEITPRIITLLDDMRETLHRANGCGLAAPQVGVRRRIVLVEAEVGQLYEMINPEIIYSSQERQNELEGCLSLPEQWGLTDRPLRVTVRATDRYGKTYEVTGEDLLARAICHELDHLDGRLFTDCATRMFTAEEMKEMSEQ